MVEINGYKLLGKLTTQNAGFCQWGFCEKSGREYFIKEFLSPSFPLDNSGLSSKIIERKRKICDSFYAQKKELYDTLNKCRTGNNIIIQFFFRNGSRYYIVTDRVDSDGTDPTIISKLSNKKKEVFLRSLLYSVAKLHECGIIHADLKPDNILLKKTTNGYYTGKIIDFDASFLVGKEPEEIQVDSVYLAPEVKLRMNGEQIQPTEKLDIFSLGILFHQYWTGNLPKIDSKYDDIFEAVLDGNNPQLSHEIPTDLRLIISKMLSADPQLRPTANDILDIFKAQDAHPKPASEPPVTPGKKEPAHDEPDGFFIPKDLD